MPRTAPSRPIRIRSVLAACLLLGGCTICPDPFDHSGPVPNGSAPQNDFRARSNGIVPIGIAPRPWPPVVKREPAAAPAAKPRAVVSAPEPDEVPAVIGEGAADIANAFEQPAAAVRVR